MRVLTENPVTRQRVLWHDESDGGVVVESRQDVESIVEDAKRLRNASDGQFKGDHEHRVGMIPLTLYERMHRERWSGKEVLRWLDNPDNRVFKLTTASLSR